MKDRYAGVANQFATTEILAFLISLPVMFLVEGFQFGRFLDLLFTDAQFRKGLSRRWGVWEKMFRKFNY